MPPVDAHVPRGAHTLSDHSCCSLFWLVCPSMPWHLCIFVFHSCYHCIPSKYILLYCLSPQALQEVFQKQVIDSKAHAATGDEINELLARSEEELELFTKWDDEEAAAAEVAKTQGTWREPLMGLEELPAWVTAPPKEEEQVGG